MGRQKRDANHFPPKNEVVQYLEWNEENRYPDTYFNKTKINYTKKPNEAHRNTLKEEILQVINENFMEMLLYMVNQNIQESLKKYQENWNKEYKKHKNKWNSKLKQISP
jgi:disulfide oxidoreductase YuzD